MTGPRLILVNGLPGIGKSTLAQRYLAQHRGVLCVDADLLRTWIGGDPREHAEASRVLALAMATSHLATGQDVVMPQLVANVDQLRRFDAAAVAGGGELVQVLVTGHVPPARVPIGAVTSLDAYARGLEEVQRSTRHHTVGSRQDDPDGTYGDLLAVLRGIGDGGEP